MTGSSSDDWILLALRLQPLLITLNHNAIAIPHTLQSLFTLNFSVLICIHNSLLSLRAATALVPIGFSTKSHTPYITTLQLTYSLHRATSSSGYLPPPTELLEMQLLRVMLGIFLHSRGQTAENRASSVASYGVSRDRYTLLCNRSVA
jgi:hypothetical protein